MSKKKGRTKYKRLSTLEQANLKRALVAGKRTTRELAAAFGIGQPRVMYWKDKFGLIQR